MSEKKHSLPETVEETLACTGFAEEGEPCPLSADAQENSSGTPPETSEGEEKSVLQAIENSMACSAFAEAGENCPIETGKNDK